MLRSLSSANSGLAANQDVLDIISNNITNSNTTAFKSQSGVFEDNISQALSDATAPSNAYGGQNAEQIGLGTNIGGITTDTTQGALTATGRKLDLGISNAGYFMVAAGDNMYNESDCITVDDVNHSVGSVPTGTEVAYTRDGTFQTDRDGNLITSDGHKVLGYSMMGRELLSTSGATSYFGDVVSMSRNQGASTLNGASSNTADSSVITGDGVSTVTNAITSVLSRPAANGSGSDVVTAGDIAFVDANAPDLRADDTHLHTLKIPSSVKEFYTSDGGKTIQTKDVMVKSYAISNNGLITLTLADNKVAAVGQIAMANFTNPEGLTKQGGNLLDVSANSGQAELESGYAAQIKGQDNYNNSVKAKDNSAAFGTINSGYLESSNVDLAKQFTDMIVASKAYQANGKSITTAQEILQDLVNLIS